MIVQQIIQKAMLKAQAAQALLTVQETSAVDFQNDRLKSAESSQRTEIQVKVIVDGKVGVSTTTDLQDVDGVVARALEAAEFGSPAHYELPAAAELTPVKTFDPKLIGLDKREMIHLGETMMDMIKSYNPEILAGSRLHKTLSKMEYANSNGAAYSSEHTDYSVGAGGELVRGTDILFTGHGLAQKKRGIDTEDIAEKAIEQFRMAEGIGRIRSGMMPVVFTPNALILMLITLSLGLDGKNVLLGASPLRNRLGETIADPRLTIIDDPFLDYGPRSGAFDNEGTPRQVTPLIEKGVLKNFIYDLDTAGQAGAKPTGHGSTRALTNIIIQPGDVPLEQMLSGIKEGLMVDSLLGLGQGNPINGEFSNNVYLGFKIENGKLVGRLKDVMIAGNVYEALEDITAISQEQEEVSGPFSFFCGKMPYIQIGGASVISKETEV
jgi:PmbA protein